MICAEKESWGGHQGLSLFTLLLWLIFRVCFSSYETIWLITTDLPGLLTTFLLDWFPCCDLAPETPDALKASPQSSWAGWQRDVVGTDSTLQGGCQNYHGKHREGTGKCLQWLSTPLCSGRERVSKLNFFTWIFLRKHYGTFSPTNIPYSGHPEINQASVKFSSASRLTWPPLFSQALLPSI